MFARFAKKGAPKKAAKGGKGRFAGVALHGDSIRYVELSGGKGPLQVVKQERVELAPGAIVRDALHGWDAIAVSLDALKRAVGGFSCPVVLGVPSREVTMRLIEFPRIPIEEVKENLQEEFDKYFPYPYTEAAADVAEVDTPSPDAAQKSTVLVATCKLRIVSDIVNLTSRMGMSLAAVEPMNVAFFRAALGPETRSDSYFVVLVEPDTTQIILGYRDNGILFRSTTADLTRLEIRESDEGLLPILRDIENTIFFAGNQYRGLTPTNLILGGITGRDSRLVYLLESSANLTVTSLNVWDLWRTQSVSNQPGFDVAFGLAVRNLS